MLKPCSKSLTAAEIAHIHAIANKGYSRQCIAALFNVSLSTIYQALRYHSPPLDLPLMRQRKHFRLNWSQRVIWGASCTPGQPTASGYPLA